MVSVKLIIISVLVIGLVAAGGVGAGIKLFDKIKFEANKIRGARGDRS